MAGEATQQLVRVVVAEDEALIRLDLVELLTESGYDVVAACGDGRAAIEAVERLKPDVVVLDVKMPVLDGLAAAEAIAATRQCAIVMLTAFSQRELVERAASAGAMAYLVKPFGASDLIPALEVARSRFMQTVALEREVADLKERMETRKAVEQAKGALQQRLGLTEPEAFRWLQKAAMDKRMSMGEVAAVVLAELSQ